MRRLLIDLKNPVLFNFPRLTISADIFIIGIPANMVT